MERFSRALRLEVNRAQTIVLAHRVSSAATGAAGLLGRPLTEVLRPVGVSKGPTFHGLLAGHRLCRYSFLAGSPCDTIEVFLSDVDPSRGSRGRFATLDRAVEVSQELDALQCTVLAAVPVAVPPETRLPEPHETLVMMEILSDNLRHPLAVFCHEGATIVALLPSLGKRILSARFSAFKEDCASFMSERYGWKVAVQVCEPESSIGAAVLDVIARANGGQRLAA